MHAGASVNALSTSWNGGVAPENTYETTQTPIRHTQDARLFEDAPEAEPGEVWSLVERVQDGDADAFGLIYDAYVDMVFRYVYFRVHDRHLAEDFASETFTRALRRIDSVSFQGRDIGAWLITIARNIIRDHVKSSRYKLEITSADMRDADRATEGPEDAVLAGLTHAELLRCVKQLSPEQQECIALRFLQGLSVSETALVMERNDGAIKALQHRAVRRLGKLLPEGLQ
ncbi:sigma-70 family RNA polymerase sigma factor [soil metagenome]|jgi:RNA polymerase sigma-70 factor (ECF subfamily)